MKKTQTYKNNLEIVNARELLLLNIMEKDNLRVIYQEIVEFFPFLGVLCQPGAIYSCTAIEENICLLGFQL